MNLPDLRSQLSLAAQAPVLMGHPLAGECTFRIGGPADFFCAPVNPSALKDILALARQNQIRIFILGGGSNVLFEDRGYPGLVVSTRGLKTCRRIPAGVAVGAGLTNDALTAFTVKEGLSGFEWACGLPGTVGGGVFMNAKCYGASFSDRVDEVCALDPEGREVRVAAAECGFAYKQSVFQQNGYVLTEIHLRLSPGNPETIQQAGETNRLDRVAKGQFDFPSAGCAFKNAYAINTPAGKLVEGCGLKGRRIGGAEIYERHANFIINKENAKAVDVVALVELVKQEVRKKYQFALEEEIRIVA
jgi:UDP-N-acetylmuramate dehydrogenase